jgi:hypothetical protein
MCLGLAACGGNSSGSGGGDGSPVALATNLNAEGAWHSEQSNGDVMDLVLLENGSLYAMTPSTKTGALVLAFNQGAYSITGNQMTSVLVYYNDLGTTLTGTVRGTIVQGTSITGTASTSGSPTINTFAASPTTVTDSSYNYNGAAALATIAGQWLNGTLLKGSTPVIFTIDATTGALAGTNLGCSYTDTVLPRASGKNVFDVTMTYGQTPCATPDTTFSGIAISYIASNGKQQFSAALQDSTKTLGTMLYAQR